MEGSSPRRSAFVSSSRESFVKKIRHRLTYANVMSSIAVFLVLGGAAFAAVQLPKNSVGTKQLKKKAVTTAKIKDDAVTGAKANEATFGQVPSAASATNASHASSADKATDATNATNALNANTVGGHSASCPANTILIRGLCFDSTPNAVTTSVFSASDNCRAKGGWLPTPLALRSTADVLDLGTGVGTDVRYTDSVYTNDAGTTFSTMTIVDSGGFTQASTLVNAQYFCVYPLVR
jgi:hypothetical protein